MNPIPVDQLIWAVKNKDCLAPYERDEIIRLLVEKESKPSIPANILLSDTE